MALQHAQIADRFKCEMHTWKPDFNCEYKISITNTNASSSNVCKKPNEELAGWQIKIFAFCDPNLFQAVKRIHANCVLGQKNEKISRLCVAWQFCIEAPWCWYASFADIRNWQNNPTWSHGSSDRLISFCHCGCRLADNCQQASLAPLFFWRRMEILPYEEQTSRKVLVDLRTQTAACGSIQLLATERRRNSFFCTSGIYISKFTVPTRAGSWNPNGRPRAMNQYLEKN